MNSLVLFLIEDYSKLPIESIHVDFSLVNIVNK